MLKCQVVYFTREYKNPVCDFLDNLNSIQQAKVLRIFQNIEEYGLLSVIPHLKKLTGKPFWEIRILGKDNIRLIIVATKQKVIVLHGFIKKDQKTPVKELNIAYQRYKILMLTNDI